MFDQYYLLILSLSDISNFYSPMSLTPQNSVFTFRYMISHSAAVWHASQKKLRKIRSKTGAFTLHFIIGNEEISNLELGHFVFMVLPL